MDCPCCHRGCYVEGQPCEGCGHPNCEEHGTYPRQAQSAGSKTGRPWSSREKYMLYAQGFGDGAKCSAMKHPGFAAYERGYADGRRERANAVSKYCEEIGYEPSILRTQGADPSGVDTNPEVEGRH